MMNARNILLIGSALLVSACAEFDMHGQNPQEYYAKHPIVNKVETQYLTQVVHFEPYQNTLDSEQRQMLKQHFTRISPLAIDDLEIQVHPSQMNNIERGEYLMKTLSQMGISRKQMHMVGMEEVERHDASIQVAYSTVVSPRCPDWRPSGVTSYANMIYTPNIGCANVVNLGLMVADPRDLVEGSGDNSPDTHSTTRAIQEYRSGETPAATNMSGESGTGETGSTGQ